MLFLTRHGTVAGVVDIFSVTDYGSLGQWLRGGDLGGSLAPWKALDLWHADLRRQREVPSPYT